MNEYQETYEKEISLMDLMFYCLKKLKKRRSQLSPTVRAVYFGILREAVNHSLWCSMHIYCKKYWKTSFFPSCAYLRR